MHRTCFYFATLLITAAVAAAEPAQLESIVRDQLPKLLETYRHLHAHPELSTEEKQTAALLAERMRAMGYDVTTGIGGHGIVAIMKNGDGPTVMIRTDMDALPITEETGLPFASTVPGVMHACGHDLHMANWLGVAGAMARMKEQWRGTVMFVGQPAEERVQGAKQMLDDGLFTRFDKPDYALALHVDPYLPVGMVGFTPGPAMANLDAVTITVQGRGGHASAPQTTIDPVVIAARLVLDLQTIVSREVDPVEGAVVTVGSIQGGEASNVVPESVVLKLSVRTFTDGTRKKVLEAIERKTKAAAASAGAPEPTVEYVESTPATVNDPKLTARVRQAVAQSIGADRTTEQPPVMASEDFGYFGKAGVPILMMRLGSIDMARLVEAKKTGVIPPSIHSPRYAPSAEGALATGITAMTAAVLELVQTRNAERGMRN